MDKTLKAVEFRDVFQNFLKINARTISVKTLLSERNLRRIDYSPYYQRNYVWDIVKQTFFIESVILGTEIPPIILFKAGNRIEVIDGRQRFETLKRFKENDFSLSINGLKELRILSKKSFNKLSEENKEIFLNSNIRVFEFEVINQPDLKEEIIDRIKKEIFRRYNTGITPLTKEELDNAKYDDDPFSEKFKNELKKNAAFFVDFNSCFFPKEELAEVNTGLIAKDVDFIRRFRILNSFPITTYAAGSNRSEVIDLLYDFAKNSSDDPETEFINFRDKLTNTILISKDLAQNGIANKLINECILWGISVVDKEEVDLDYHSLNFIDYYKNNLSYYTEDSSHYYRRIIDRYSNTAQFFEKLSGLDFSIYIKDEEFRYTVSDLKQTEVDATKSIEELSNLRLHKPNPISTPIDEVRNDLKTSRYLVRPSYQRQEKINFYKASSIIESILLGINLPPIFIFNRSNNVKEVVDGQQRLLAIIGFLGEQYINETGKLSYSKNNNFKLKGLKILTELEGRSYNALPYDLQDKIVDFVVDLIVIEQSVNKKFDPIDLFIRLNYKPYPIKNNSFEMWNSIVNIKVVTKIKEEVVKAYKDWFFLREVVDGKADRMQNEEMVTILSYIIYNRQTSLQNGVIGFFPRRDRITCRLMDKKGLGDFLVNLEINAIDKEKFLSAIERTKELIGLLLTLFDDKPSKETFNEFLNVKNSANFKRSLQDFYVIWLIIDKIPAYKFSKYKEKILKDIRMMLTLLRNNQDLTVDNNYMNNFYDEYQKIIAYYN